MAHRQLRIKQAIDQETQETALSDRPLAIIARQSTTRQTRENLESLRLQVEDARERFINQGWSEDIITVRVAGDGKRGVSGTLRIDQRKELQDTIADIEAGKIKAVGAYSVSRLFRDKWGIQVGTFMEVCAKHDVLVILPNRVYDFNDSNDRLIFKLEAEFAAKDNEVRTRLMTDARRRKSMRGEYDGRPIVVGFIVDRDKQLPDGKPNPNYGHFIPYEPHAKVVRWLYRRYRELGGRFNLLANEVAKMPVLFPDFEEWVNSLDASRLQLKKVPGGYSISRFGLFHLMTAIEYMGYWKLKGEVLTDESGRPLVVHAPIVDSEDWLYSFKRQSWTTLQGQPNTERLETSSGWVSSRETKGRVPLLKGILKSSMGKVWTGYDKDGHPYYRVAAHGEGLSQSDNVLTVDANMVGVLFSARLSERLVEMHDMGKEDVLRKQLAQLESKNKRALAGVDKQVARYKNEIAGIQAYIKATGATADEKTLQDYNAQILDARANLDALVAKKNAAKVKENSMQELIRRIGQLTGSDCLCSTETSRGFIELACERISLDEYSGRFVTLTIEWAVPFAQTDVCYIYRKGSGHQEWTDDDETDLARLYPHADRKTLLERFPTRTWASIMTWASLKGLKRDTALNTSGISDRMLSLRDHELLTREGWSLGDTHEGTEVSRRHWWTYDVSNSSELAVTSKH
jgi:DNA invertase Pin-like site-specific DNA recombinase